jgi:1H-pyrrole-2-carbonyl-[peptidyl-carrier protein] chlorinase
VADSGFTQRTDGPADVVIVGGGPAGSTLGFLLATAGYRVVLLERLAFPRDHVGELILPSVNMILHRIGLLETIDRLDFVRREGLAWTGPCLRHRELPTIRAADFPPPRALRPYGYNVERSAFDHILLQNARRGGVRVERGTARSVIFEAGRAVGVQVHSPRGLHRLLARFVIDASGRRCLLGSQLGYRVRDQSQGQCALYSWFREARYGPDGIRYAILHLLRRDRGWAWQIPLRSGLSSVGLVVDRREFPRNANEYDAFYRQVLVDSPAIVPYLDEAKRVRRWTVEGDYSYRLMQMTGKGWLLIGDAAGFIDPVFASGVDIAMHSAFFAYQALLPLLRLGEWRDDDETFQLRRYEERVSRGMAIWHQMVGLFYERPAVISAIAAQAHHHPAIARLLQGNPYDVQNIDIADGVFRAVAQADQHDSLPASLNAVGSRQA